MLLNRKTLIMSRLTTYQNTGIFPPSINSFEKMPVFKGVNSEFIGQS